MWGDELRAPDNNTLFFVLPTSSQCLCIFPRPFFLPPESFPHPFLEPKDTVPFLPHFRG